MHHAPAAPPDPDAVAPLPRPLRIAVVTESYPPEVNGVALSVARVVHGLIARGHRLQLVRPRQPQRQEMPAQPRLQEVLTGGIALPMYGQLRMGLPSRRRLLRSWHEERPDLVHIATEGPLGWSALRAALELRLPVCSDFRTNFHAYSRFYGVGFLRQPVIAYLRHFHNRCHATMVPTHALRRQLQDAGFSALSVVARGVDTLLFSPDRHSAALRRQWGVHGSDPVALYVGRLAPEKNLELLLQAFAHMQAAQPRARLVVVGDGPSRTAIQAQCPQAVFAGFRSGEDLARHYASSDIFLFPSQTETFGNVTLEAMASGLAVVAFDDAAAGQLIRHRGNGMLAARGRVHDFVQSAVALATDAGLRRWLGTEARSTALDSGWDQVIRLVENVHAGTIQRAYAPVPAQ